MLGIRSEIYFKMSIEESNTLKAISKFGQGIPKVGMHLFSDPKSTSISVSNILQLFYEYFFTKQAYSEV